MATIEVDDDLYHLVEILFSALREGVPAMGISVFADVCLANALQELLEQPTVYELFAQKAFKMGHGKEDLEGMLAKINEQIDRSLDVIHVQNEHLENTFRASEKDTQQGEC